MFIFYLNFIGGSSDGVEADRRYDFNYQLFCTDVFSTSTIMWDIYHKTYQQLFSLDPYLPLLLIILYLILPIYSVPVTSGTAHERVFFHVLMVLVSRIILILLRFLTASHFKCFLTVVPVHFKIVLTVVRALLSRTPSSVPMRPW